MAAPDVLYVDDLVERLGFSTPAAFRMALARKSGRVPHEHMFKLGGRLVCLRHNYDAWLAGRALSSRSLSP